MSAEQPATDAIDRLLRELATAPQIAAGAALVALGVAAAVVVGRRLGRSLPPPPPPPKLRPILLPLAVLVFLAAAEIGRRLVARGTTGAGETAGGPPDLRAFALASFVVATMLLGFLAWFGVRFGGGIGDLGFTRKELGKSLRLALALYVACLPLVIGAIALESGFWRALGREAPQQKLVVAFAGDAALHDDLLVIAAIVLFAPLHEELLFRGVLQRFVARVLPAWPAILATALLFAAQHDAGRLAGFALGTALGWLFARTGNLFAPLLFHAVHNGLVLLVIAGTAQP